MWNLFLFIFIFISDYSAFNLKQCLKYKNLNQSIHEELAFVSPKLLSRTTVRYFERKIGSSFILGHAVYIGKDDHLEVLEPGAKSDGCKKEMKVLARETSLMDGNCEVVMNAGFFNTRTGKCYGNIVNRGNVIQSFYGFRNAHFGITKSGSYYFGYPTVEEVNSGKFRMLVGGVVWLIRRSKNVINESIKLECESTQDTGTLFEFCSVRSARSVIGVTRKGELVMITVGGRTNQFGISLYELTNLLMSKEFDFVDAINLDGGGSTTLIVNNTLVTLPSDKCSQDSLFVCERSVSTVLCVKYNTSTTPKYIYIILLGAIVLGAIVVIVTIVSFKLFKRHNAATSTPGNVVNNNIKYDDMLHFDREQLLEMREQEVEYLN